MPPTSAPSSRKFIGAVDDEWQMFSDDPVDYEIGLPIGFGATSIVYAARYIPKDGSPALPCAVKVVDLDKLPPQSLRLLRRETQLMSLSKHPNLLRVRGSWITGHNLCIALRLMNSGSAADVMHYGWPGGMEEEVVKCILKQALEGLNYLHINGFIHRDVKAANLLIDDDGTVLLGDLGVAASLSDEEPTPVPSGSGRRMNFDGTSSSDNSRPPTQGPSGKRLGKRKSFVGTPCWMAPELISGKQYDAKADIWSFGITAIELTQGRAPRSREAPARVLLKTVQDAPPEFARESGHHKFSKAFKDIVEACLVKDPSRRPTAVELLDRPFFKSAKRKSYLVNAILKDLPPLIHRQERRAKTSSHSLSAASRSSMSSWDFSIDLPHTPNGHVRSPHNSAHLSYFNSTHSNHSLHSHYSHHHTLALPTATPLDALEENKHVDVFEQLKAVQHELAVPDPHDVEDSHSSAESSVSDLEEEEESSPSTPEFAAASLGGSSVATTPLSCSPATALDMPVQPGRNVNPASSVQNNGKSMSAALPSATSSAVLSRPSSKTNNHSAQKDSKVQRGAPQRRGSSPASTLDRTNLGSLPALKRIASASGFRWSSSKTSSVSLAQSASESPGVGSRAASPTPKESRWRKLVRGAKGDDPLGAGPPGLLKEGERKKSSLGRILERSGK